MHVIASETHAYTYIILYTYLCILYPVSVETFAKYGRIDHFWVNYPLKSQ